MALRIVLVGAGNIASHHLPAYQQFPDEVELVAVCDLDEGLARKRAGEAGVGNVYTDVETMLREIECDAFDICVTPDQHAPIALAAIDAGKHVLVEKPFAPSLAECRRLVSRAEGAGVTLMVAQNQRFLPSHQTARAIIASGELGEIRAVRTDSVQHWADFLGPGHWQYDGARAGGGAVIGVAVHRLDLARFLVGDVRRVSAVLKTSSPHFVNGAEEYAAATFEFENGALGQAFATVSAFRTPWSESLLVYGERGTMHASPVPGNVRSRIFVASERRSPPAAEWKDQIRRLRTDRRRGGGPAERERPGQRDPPLRVLLQHRRRAALERKGQPRDDEADRRHLRICTHRAAGRARRSLTVKLGVLDSVIGGRDDLAAFERALSIGCAGVEVMLLSHHLRGTGKPAALRAARAATGLEIPSFVLDEHNFGGISSADPSVASAAADDVRTAVAWAADLDVGAVLVPFFVEAEIRDEPAFERAVKAFRELCPLAAASGVVLAYEGTLPAARVRALAERVSSPGFGCYFDLANLVVRGLDPPTEIRNLADLICRVHVKDLRARKNDCHPGLGRVDFPACAAALAAIGYDGWLVLETPAAPPPVVGRDVVFTSTAFGVDRGPANPVYGAFSDDAAGWEELADTFASLGAGAVQLGGSLLERCLDDPGFANEGRTVLERRGLRLPALSGYRNLVAPDAAVREENLAHLRRCLEVAPLLGTWVVATGAGTRSTDHDWADHHDNWRKETWELLEEAVDLLLPAAEASDTVLALEGTWMTALRTFSQLIDLLERHPSPSLQLVCDPYNYVSYELLPAQDRLLDEYPDPLRVALRARAPEGRRRGRREDDASRVRYRHLRSPSLPRVLAPTAPRSATRARASPARPRHRCDRPRRGVRRVMPRELLLTAPRAVELASYDDVAPRAGQVRADAVASGISLGTELALYRGDSPFRSKRFDLDLRLFVDDPAEAFPTRLGYEWVGVVRDVGAGVAAPRVGERIHVTLPHRETQTFDVTGPPWTSLPAQLSDERATLLQSTAIALQAVRDAQIGAGERVAVFGLGTFGLLAVQLARLDDPGFLVAIDPLAERRELALAYGADLALDPTSCDVGLELKSAGRAVDVAIEISGRYDALQQALRCVRVAGLVVAAGFYVGEASPLRLGEEWLHNRLTMVASMQGWGVPSRQEGWDRQRLRTVALELLLRLETDELLTHSFRFDEAPGAYATLDANTIAALRGVFRYSEQT